jgi:hypothetical protein
VNKRISTFVVADCSVYSVRLGIEYEDFVLFGMETLNCGGESEFEWHVETNRRIRATEVVNRHTTRAHKLNNASESTFSRFSDLEDTVRLLAQANECCDQCHEERLVLRIERCVDEDTLYLFTAMGRQMS